MNQIVLIGRLTANPELSYTPNSQTAVCRFTLAVNRPRREGQDQGADFIRITVWGRQAENCDRYLAKGRQAAVHGRIQTGSYKNREGVTVNTVDVIANNVEFLGGATQEATQGRQLRQEQPMHEQTREPAYTESVQASFDDLPDNFSISDDDVPW